MTDIVSKETRSRMMSGIRSKDTRPEMIIRKELFKRGFRYRLHVRGLPGKPDLSLKKYKAAIFVHGCFWHGHKCSLFRMPASNRDFWKAKIESNRLNDVSNQRKLLESGWRVYTVWECSIRGKNADLGSVIESLSKWLVSQSAMDEISGFEMH